MSTSSKIEDVVDFATDGPQPLVLKRQYRGRGSPGWRLGGGRWRFDFEYELVQSGMTVTVYSPDGTEYLFDEVSTNVFASHYKEARVLLTRSTNSPYVYFSFTDESDQTVNFEGTQGQFWPTSVVSRNGDSLSIDGYYLGTRPRVNYYVYGDNYDRRISFAYEDYNGAPRRITTASFYIGSSNDFKIEYGYANDNLTSVTRWAKVQSVWTQVDQTTYHYEDTNSPDLLTGITDARGVRYATWGYDSQGRVTSSTHAGGAENTSISYSDSPLTRTVTTALGKQAIYSFATREDSVKLTSVAGQASTNCPASSRGITYNTDGQVSQTVDEEGRVTAYVRDAYGRPTSITRGSGTAEASTTTFTYHPTLNVPTQVVEPGLTTGYTWTNGRLTQVTQTDTTTHSVPYSTNGQTRIWTFGYTGTRLTSVDGPLAGTSDTVTYTYDSNGYLATATNELGHVTTVNSKNSKGQPTTITDANGIVSNLTYDHVGRLKMVTTDATGLAAVTTVDYDAIGQVTKRAGPGNLHRAIGGVSA